MRTRQWIAGNRERYAFLAKRVAGNNREKTRGYVRFYTYRAKQEILDHYGHRRRNCGITDDDVLVVDHVNNDGAAHRKRIKNAYSLHKSIKDAGFPASFQILCCNCNWKKHLNGGML